MFSYFICGILGVTVGRYTSVGELVWGVLALLFSVLSVAAYILFKNNKRIRLGIWLIAALSIICMAAMLTQRVWKDIQVNWNDTQQQWIGVVESVQKKGEKTTTYDVRLSPLHHLKNECNVRLYVENKHKPQLHMGDKIAFSGIIKSEKKPNYPNDFDLKTYLLVHQISGYCYVKENAYLLIPTTKTFSFKHYFLSLREQLSNLYLKYFNGVDMALLSAITLGDKSLLHTDTRQLFAETGTSHVLALSGLHLGILFTLLNWVFLPLLKRNSIFRFVAFACVISLLWLFVLLSGCSLSIVRSACMFTLAQMAGIIKGGKPNGLNNLSIAGIVILLFDPLALFDVGFQLSFTAVLSIIVVNQFVWNRFPLPIWKYSKANASRFERCEKTLYTFFRNVIYPFICVSLSAQWGTFPLVAYYFHIFSPYAVIANFAVIPAAYLLLCGALAFFILPFDICRNIIASFLQGVISALQECLYFIASWHGATFSINFTMVTLASVIVIPIIIYEFFEIRQKRRRQWLIVAFFCLLATDAVAENFFNNNYKYSPCIVVYKTPRATITHFIHSYKSSYLLSSTSQTESNKELTYIKHNFWEVEGFASPQWLNTSTKSQYISQHEDLILFHGKRIYCLRSKQNTTIASNKPFSPIHVDLLIVENRCYTPFETAKRFISPQRVILSSALSSYKRQQWKEACSAANIPCWDIAEQGVYVWDIPYK